MENANVKTLIPLPKDSVPLEVVEVVGYLSEDGLRRWAVRYGGNMPLSSTIGLLRIAEFHIMHDHKKRAQIDEEDNNGEND